MLLIISQENAVLDMDHLEDLLVVIAGSVRQQTTGTLTLVMCQPHSQGLVPTAPKSSWRWGRRDPGNEVSHVPLEYVVNSLDILRTISDWLPLVRTRGRELCIQFAGYGRFLFHPQSLSNNNKTYNVQSGGHSRKSTSLGPKKVST